MFTIDHFGVHAYTLQYNTIVIYLTINYVTYRYIHVNTKSRHH